MLAQIASLHLGSAVAKNLFLAVGPTVTATRASQWQPCCSASSRGPTVGALVGFAVLGEVLSGWQLLAVVLIVMASAGAVAGSARKPDRSGSRIDQGPG